MAIFEILLVIIVTVIFTIILLGKGESNKKGSIYGRAFRKWERYVNIENGTMGRIAGEMGIDPVGANKQYSHIRYKTGMFSKTKIDPYVPNWAIHRIYPPECQTPEGIVFVEFYKTGNKLAKDKTIYMEEIERLNRQNKTLGNIVSQLKTYITTTETPQIAQDQLNTLLFQLKEMQKTTRIETEKKELIIPEMPEEQKKKPPYQTM